MKTEHTEEMAFAVAGGPKQVDGVDVNVKKVNQTSIEDLPSADGIIKLYPTSEPISILGLN